jgi:ribA/ribD-fused uncharacterized protein
MVKFRFSNHPFSNFYPAPLLIDGVRWPTSEHYFQAQKFQGTEYEEEIRNLPTPKDAATRGRDRSLPLCKNWEDIKIGVMAKALRYKFSFEQHPELLKVLLETGDQEIVEDAPWDSYWGIGRGDGQNMLGKLLMELRDGYLEEGTKIEIVDIYRKTTNDGYVIHNMPSCRKNTVIITEEDQSLGVESRYVKK